MLEVAKSIALVSNSEAVHSAMCLPSLLRKPPYAAYQLENATGRPIDSPSIISVVITCFMTGTSRANPTRRWCKACRPRFSTSGLRASAVNLMGGSAPTARRRKGRVYAQPSVSRLPWLLMGIGVERRMRGCFQKLAHWSPLRPASRSARADTTSRFDT
jgi:hypothetical protein